MNIIKNDEAMTFYNDLINKNIVEKNEIMKQRISEVVNWKAAFVTLLKHAPYFKINIIEKQKLIEVVKKYQFKEDFIVSLKK